MRGALLAGLSIKPLPGIIPAYAGSTWPCSASPRRWEDHPRVCGEHAMSSWVSSWNLGSSPRMRGALQQTSAAPVVHGIIPAYAGSTNRVTISKYQLKDHPRVCGEHCFMPIPNKGHFGSSPRMRGAPSKNSINRVYCRIIPAYAGSTEQARAQSWDSGDHPRVCGEHIGLTWICSARSGSSPRMRGAPGGARSADRHERIIPAYAGSTA